MTPKALAALNGSICNKWEKIESGIGYDAGAANCPLCRAFHPDAIVEKRCAGCPVKEHTGRVLCRGTPYETWARHFSALKIYPGLRRRVTDDETRALAQAELDFLRSLLPEEHRKVSERMDTL